MVLTVVLFVVEALRSASAYLTRRNPLIFSSVKLAFVLILVRPQTWSFRLIIDPFLGLLSYYEGDCPHALWTAPTDMHPAWTAYPPVVRTFVPLDTVGIFMLISTFRTWLLELLPCVVVPSHDPAFVLCPVGAPITTLTCPFLEFRML